MKRTSAAALLAPAVMALALAASSADGGDDGYYQEGDAVADADLVGLDGKTVKLHSFKGKPILINFYASW